MRISHLVYLLALTVVLSFKTNSSEFESARTETIVSAIESKVDGTWNGWDGDTVVKLVNGQIWEQAEYHYEYRYAYRPDVLIYSSGGKIKMQVEGMREAVAVTRIK
jgi:hypothetical protein